MIEVRYERGVHLPVEGLWLDPGGPRDFAFVSHAHSDHTGRHGEAILTEATSRLMRARLGEPAGREHVLAYRERVRLRSFEIMLIPAGHVLGSAQCWIGTDEGSLLYTGDFKLRRGLSSEAAEAEPAETLIMETTFGLSRYVFPPAEEVIAQVVKFCRETLEEEGVPVLLGYSLGKAQEILSALAGAGIPIMLHGAIRKMTEIYESLGVQFPEYVKYDATAAAGHALVCPPGVNGSAMLRKIPKRRTACLTGWAMDPNAIYRMQVDAAFPLSDHADYEELIRHVEQVGPRRVLTLHGFAQEFARDLRERGIEAWALTGANQLELGLALKRPVRAAGRKAREFRTDDGFGRFCEVCGQVGATTGKLEKIRILSGYLAQLDDSELRVATVWLTGNAFPQTLARPLHAGWAILRRALLAVSGLSSSDFQAIARRHNDAGLTTEEALAGQLPASNPPLVEIQEFFAALAAARGPIAKTVLLEERLQSLGATAAKFLVKILTGDLRIGLKEGLVEDAIAAAFAADAAQVREAHMLLGDLGDTAIRARAGALGAVELTPFRPVKCMLASPEPDGEAVWSRLTGAPGFPGEAWIEDKLDGIRAQIHAADGRVEIFSRDLRRITETFPEITSAARTGAFVLDGEILAWQEGRPLGFSELQKRLGRVQRDFFMASEVPVTFAAFDILWLDGRSLFRRPLAERRAILESLDLGGALTIAPVSRVRSAEAIEAEFVAARKRGNEGLMIKDPATPYTPGRRGMAWIKLKKAFATLDVVVVAVEYGHGKRSCVLSDYTFAIRDEAGGLATIGKAYSGLTDAEIAELTEVFQASVIGQRGYAFEVRPEVVLEIAFDSVQPSGRHESGFALRFPRIKGIRRDKTVADIDSIETVRRLAAG